MSNRKRRCMAAGVHEGRRWRCRAEAKAPVKTRLCWSHYRQYVRGADKFTPIRKYRKDVEERVAAMLAAGEED